MKKYKITLPNNMSVIIEANSMKEAERQFNTNYPTISNYEVTG